MHTHVHTLTPKHTSAVERHHADLPPKETVPRGAQWAGSLQLQHCSPAPVSPGGPSQWLGPTGCRARPLLPSTAGLSRGVPELRVGSARTLWAHYSLRLWTQPSFLPQQSWRWPAHSLYRLSCEFLIFLPLQCTGDILHKSFELEFCLGFCLPRDCGWLWCFVYYLWFPNFFS